MYRKIFLWGNIALFVVIVLAIGSDTFRPWMPYQRKYRAMQIEAETAPEAKQIIAARPIQIKQTMLPDLGEVDRCMTCHQGMDPLATPSLTNSFKENPFKSHPGDFLTNHPPDKFGCVVCHRGQGLATTFIGAAHSPKNEEQKKEWKKHHDWEPAEHWHHPMLNAPFIQASCVKCHDNFESIQGLEVAAKGKQLLSTHGCMGCHQWRGEGGPISVDLAEETANKPLSRIDFSHTGLDPEDQTLLNWVRLHFVKDTWELVPGDPKGKYNAEPIAPSGMPDYREELSTDDATALTTFILSGRTSKYPHNYHVSGPSAQTFQTMKFRSRIQAGKWVFDKYGCAGCHGLNGVGGRRNYNYTGGFNPSLIKTVGTYTRDELRKKIKEGVAVVGKEDPEGPTPPLYMPPWEDKIKGEEMEALLDYLFSIAEKTEDWGD